MRVESSMVRQTHWLRPRATQGVVNEPLAPKDFGALIQTLVYDGRVELDPDGQDDELFRVARLPPPDASAFAAMPCGVCPVRGSANVAAVCPSCAPSSGHEPACLLSQATDRTLLTAMKALHC